MTMDVRNLATGDGGVSTPTDTARITTPYINTPAHMPTFVKCGACHRLAFNMVAEECHDCGYNGRCGGCGVTINPTDYFTPFACSASCDAEMGAWAEADRKAR